MFSLLASKFTASSKLYIKNITEFAQIAQKPTTLSISDNIQLYNGTSRVQTNLQYMTLSIFDKCSPVYAEFSTEVADFEKNL